MGVLKNKKNLAVGIYIPQAGFIASSYIAVMNAETRQLEAIVGRLDSLVQPGERNDDFYREAAENLEQANLYAKAPELLEMLEFILLRERGIDHKTFMRANALVKSVKNIQEPATRILTDHGYQMIKDLKQNKNEE